MRGLLLIGERINGRYCQQLNCLGTGETIKIGGGAMNMHFCQKTIGILSLLMNVLSESALLPKNALEEFGLGSRD